MITLFHQNEFVQEVSHHGESSSQLDSQLLSGYHGQGLIAALKELASIYPEEILVWCSAELKDWLQVESISKVLVHPLVLLSYRQVGDPFGGDLDFIEYSTAIKVPKDVKYPTWKMSATVGAAQGSLIHACSDQIPLNYGADFYFCGLAKLYSQEGLLSYSYPDLLRKHAPLIDERLLDSKLKFAFVRSFFTIKWTVFLFIALIHYSKRSELLAFLNSLGIKRKFPDQFTLQPLRPGTETPETPSDSIDVLIPTLGREAYVEDLLSDLASQTWLPSNVILIEQEKENGAGSQLAHVTEKNWPFQIEHVFSQQRGPCYARNLGLEQVSSNWLFLADDDIRIQPNFLKEALSKMRAVNVEAATFSCLLAGQREEFKYIHQIRIFGAGCSIISKEIADQIRFDMAYEFGYAEDSDFGARIRNLGFDVVYIPEPSILHLKAPTGGFRAPLVLPWQLETISPKPSPTVMLFWMRHFTEKQFWGNKLMIFFEMLKRGGYKRPFRFKKEFLLKWNLSLAYAQKLDKGILRVSA